MSAYLIGSCLGGLAAGALAGSLGAVVPSSARSAPWAGVVVVLALLVGLSLDVRARGGGLPSWRRQVDEDWLSRYRGWVYGMGFGLQLGAGVLTIVTSSTVYAVLLLAAWGGRPDLGAAIGLLFGLARAVPLLAMRGVQSPADLHRWFARIERLRPVADRAARGALVVTALAVAGTVWS